MAKINLMKALQQNAAAEAQNEQVIKQNKRLSDADKKDALKQLESMREFADEAAKEEAKESQRKK